jgi:dTDP-glucose 4,6-dehydratase
VDDNCSAILAVLENGRPGTIYNIGTEEERRNLEVVHAVCGAIAEITGMDASMLHKTIQLVADRPSHDRRYAICAAKIKKEIGWAPRISFNAGLQETVRWYVENEKWISSVTAGDYQRCYDSVYIQRWSQRF